MRWLGARLRCLVLVVLAGVVVVQPLASSLSLFLAQDDVGPFDESVIVICSSHGLMVLGEDGTLLPIRSKEKPPCPWCAVGASGAGHLPAVAEFPIGLLLPPLLLHASMEEAESDLRLPRSTRASCSPRAPPPIVVA